VNDLGSITSQAPREETVAYARNLELALFQQPSGDSRTELLAHALEKFFQDGHALERGSADAEIERWRRDYCQQRDLVYEMSALIDRYRRCFEHVGLKKPDEEAAG